MDNRQGMLASRTDLDLLLSATFGAAAGVMLALCITAWLWPPPGIFTGTHPVILDSQLSQLRIEPREKAFLALATITGFLTAFAALARGKPTIRCTWRSLLMLAILIPVFNICCDRALNEPSGIWYAFAGLGVSVGFAAAGAFAARPR